MLDIHTHILPGMDDGSKTPEQSVEMLACEAFQGISTVAMTPHYHAGREAPADFVSRRGVAEQALRQALRAMENPPQLLCGAEVAYFDSMCRAEEIDQLRIQHTRAMLVEMPFCRWNQRMVSELQELRHLRGIQPVLAHVERYASFQPHGWLEELLDQGMLIQVNASFFLRWQTAWKAMALLKRRKIHFVASDCHDLKMRTPELLGAALQKIETRIGTQATAMLRENAGRLLGG